MLRYGPTIALVFVLAVAAIKAIVEDKKRHDEDRKTNNTTAHLVLEDGMHRYLCTREEIESPLIRQTTIGAILAQFLQSHCHIQRLALPS